MRNSYQNKQDKKKKKRNKGKRDNVKNRRKRKNQLCNLYPLREQRPHGTHEIRSFKRGREEGISIFNK